MLKGHSLKKIKIIIENKINNMFNSTIKDIPKELFLKYFESQANDWRVDNNKSPCKKANNRISHGYQINDSVLVKKQNRMKLEDLYEGPYNIVQKKGDQLIVCLNGLKTMEVNIKNVKPFFSEKGVSVVGLEPDGTP